MDRIHYEEMEQNLDKLLQDASLYGRNIYLFGHCNASEELADLLGKKGWRVRAILDNNVSKQGREYRGIPIVAPAEIMTLDEEQTIVCIAARAYAAMERQLRRMGYGGIIRRLVDYDSYAEYSLSEETVRKRQKRVDRGRELLKAQRVKYPGCYQLYCPFSALGDVYYMMAYLPYFLQKRWIEKYVVFTIGAACAEVAEMFGARHVEAFSQKEMDESIQAVLYNGEEDAYIPHQDRPYVVKLAKALHIKKIPLEMIYKCGVYGLDPDCIPYKPVRLETCKFLDQIVRGRAVVLSPHAKSVAGIPGECWKQIVRFYREKGYQIFTNVAGDERAIEGTVRLEVKLSELQSVVERAGTFIGIRSGLCDVIREADCRKIALYPDCYYSDTRWKMEEIYHLESFENIVVGDRFQ